MFDKIQNWFEDPENFSFIIILKIMKFSGMWFTGRSILMTVIFAVNFSFLMIYMISIWMHMLFRFSYYAFIVFIQLSALQFGVYKIGNFIRNHEIWENLIVNLHEIERMAIEDASPNQYHVIVTYRKYCNAVIATMFIAFVCVNIPYVTFFFVTKLLLADFSKPFKITDNLYNTLLPIDETTRNGRTLSVILQVLFTEISAVYLILWDMLVLIGLMFYVGQMKLLHLRFAQLLDYSEEDICLHRIVRCHRHYLRLVRCHKIFNDLVSPVMFAYLILITINYGALVVLLIMQKDDIVELIPTFELVIGLSFELLMFYWIGNEFILESGRLSYGIFKSKWTSSSRRVNRALLLLGVGVRHRMAFSAGPFNEVSLSTFITILRTSYSFYTLLSRKA